MRQSTELMVTERELALAGLQETEAESEVPARRGHLFHKIHLLLRERYRWAVLLASLGAVGGGAGGFFLGQPLYISYGYVRIKPVLQQVLTGDEEKGMMPFFDSFVDAQIQLMMSQRTLDMAVRSEAWKGTGKGPEPEQGEELSKYMEVTRPRGSQMIVVQVTDRKGPAAQAAVKAILGAYEKIASEQDTENGELRRQILQEQQNNLSNDLAAKQASIRAIAQEFDTDDLRKIFDFQLQQLNNQEEFMRRLERQLAAVSPGPKVPATREAHELSIEEIGLRDRQMAGLLDTKLAIERQITVLRASGTLENHRDMIRAKTELAAITAQAAARAEEYRKLAEAGMTGAPEQVALENAGPELLRARLETERKQWEKNKADLRALGQKSLQIDKLRQEEEQVKDRLDQFKKRLEQLDIENKIGGRIQIWSYGDRPRVLKDTRPRYAGAGAFLGIMAGFGLVLFRGLIDRRFRSPEEVQSSVTGSPMLGVLPELPDDLSDPEQAALTAHFVHQIRTLLQIWHSGASKHAFSITSPVAGTGKTSLTLALGVSFAAADSRTLLIDCDLVGGGLTYRANAIVKRKIGQILQREGLLSDEQLQEALKLASGSHRRLGEILVGLGYLKESDLDSALVVQQRDAIGLLNAINGEPLEDCVAETGIAGLSVLPLGGARAQQASKITPQTIRRVLAAARQQYDTVLVDTGPVRGSLEASVVAAEVDGVILCVSRGEQRPQAEESVRHLHSLNARVAGVVFNRARTTDMRAYSTTMRVSTSAPAEAAPAEKSARFGPMARALSYSGGPMPSPQNGKTVVRNGTNEA